jgi:hypothetical protein
MSPNFFVVWITLFAGFFSHWPQNSLCFSAYCPTLPRIRPLSLLCHNRASAIMTV